jgi:hypothetical protein
LYYFENEVQQPLCSFVGGDEYLTSIVTGNGHRGFQNAPMNSRIQFERSEWMLNHPEESSSLTFEQARDWILFRKLYEDPPAHPGHSFCPNQGFLPRGTHERIEEMRTEFEQMKACREEKSYPYEKDVSADTSVETVPRPVKYKLTVNNMHEVSISLTDTEESEGTPPVMLPSDFVTKTVLVNGKPALTVFSDDNTQKERPFPSENDNYSTRGNLHELSSSVLALFPPLTVEEKRKYDETMKATRNLLSRFLI